MSDPVAALALPSEEVCAHARNTWALHRRAYEAAVAGDANCRSNASAAAVVATVRDCIMANAAYRRCHIPPVTQWAALHKAAHEFDSVHACVNAAGLVAVMDCIVATAAGVRDAFGGCPLPLLHLPREVLPQTGAQADTTPMSLVSIRSWQPSDAQCYALLAAGFLCILPRVSDESADMPSVNFEELHVGHRVEMEKLRMLLEYFARSPAPERRAVGIHRVALAADATMGTMAWDAPLCPVEMRPLRESIDAPCHRGAATIRVDFANCIIGGAALSYGNVQEEIMFVECPEMLCARAVCPPAQGHEAVVLRGCAQFSDHAGYGGSLAYGGPHHDDAAAIAASCVVAVDAVDYRGASTAHQYTPGSQYRELVKLVAGFGGALRVLSDTDAPGRPQVAIVTGNWGCGVFRGDARVKFLLQWIAASLCGCRLVYCPFDNALLSTAVPPLVAGLLGRRVSCRQLWNAVLADTKTLVAASTSSVDGALGIAAAWAAGLGE